jgi:hypothetical protein
MKKLLASLATLALGIGLVATAALPAQATVVNTNLPSSWVAVTGEVCVKHDFSDPKPTTQSYAALVSLFSLTDETVTKVIVKAGSSNGYPQAQGSVEFENQAFYTDASYQLSMPSTTWTQVADLTATTFSHYSGKTISHIIVCYVVNDDPEEVSGDATVQDQTCDETDDTLVPGSITPVATTGVVYELWDATKTTKLIADFSANSGPLANGTYFVKVLPASDDYTVSEANTWLQRVVGAYPGECAPTDVSGDATVQNQTCDESDYTLVDGSITPVATTGVVYELWDATKTTKLIADFSANSGPLANGTYFVKVLPASDDYTVSEANTWLERVVGAYGGECLGEIETLGDPYVTQECVPNENLELPGTWLATLTIVATDHVQYRVYFHNGIGWDDQGIWPAGVYEAGPSGDIPYGTKVKVVAEAVGNYVLTADPNEWEFEFTQPSRCQLPDLGTVTPVVTFAQTCSAGATYTLAIEGGEAGTVLFSVNGGPTTTTLGTFSVASPSSIVIVATPGPDSGFSGDEDAEITFTKEFPALETCDLTTLALTGSGDTGAPALTISALLGLLGAALVRSAARARRLSQEA